MLHGTGRRNGTYRSILPNAAISQLGKKLDGSGTVIPVSKLVKDLGAQTDNMSSPSAQCSEAANKAKRLIFMIGRSLQDHSKSAFNPLYGALVRPHLEYGMPACLPSLVADINHLARIQRLAIRLVADMRHLPYEERLQRLGLYSLQLRLLWADLITTFKIFTGLLDVDPNLFFPPPARRGLRGHPFKVLQGASHRRRRGISAISMRLWNTEISSQLPSLQLLLSRKGKKVWTEIFPHLPH